MRSVAISFCPHLSRLCVSNLLIEESKADGMTANQKEQTSHIRSILEEIHNLRLKPRVFCVSQGTCDMKVARTPLRSGVTVFSVSGWGSQPLIWLTRQRRSGEVRGNRQLHLPLD